MKRGDFDALKTYIDTTKTSINIVNAKGYAPLHVLIENFVDYRADIVYNNHEKGQQNIRESEAYNSCLRLILDKGASVQQLTPEGWTALQYAVIMGKWKPTEELLSRTKAGDIKDRGGNTLLHLSLMTNPDNTHPEFWNRLIDRLKGYNINRYTPNLNGQTPLNFYMSQPRCQQAPNPAPGNPSKLLGAAPASPNISKCPTNATLQMLEPFKCEACNLTPDFSGKKVLEYAQLHNDWYTFTAQSSEKLYTEFAPAMAQKYRDVAESNRRATEEYLQQLAEWEAQGTKLDLSFSRTYYYECNSYQKRVLEMAEPVEVTVTPDLITVSNLSPYYGSFKVAKSGYEVVEGNKWLIYYLEKTASNSTYKAIGFYNNGCIIITNSGNDLICY